ncbi:hypothetical protein NOK91_23665 [Vibrio parahaemolyticus]|uniref:hypothetical protein n=1 Tax=Vibrio parahaemolyticus TaxID=670 RepID=UPI00226BAA3D|nr:hypothetical protein [Vibrio parahaemolyticus]MCX8890154.1 hypothetical protein [Vibrio parahaemolyticus]
MRYAYTTIYIAHAFGNPRASNAQLSSEQRNTKVSALRRKHKTHCKPKLPRVANLLELFVMRIFDNAKLTNETLP